MAQAATATTTLNIPDEQRPLDQIPISPVAAEYDKTEGGRARDDTREGRAREDTREGRAREDTREDTSQEQITVFHDQENFTVKHPLMNKWTLWFTKPPTGKVRHSWSID